MPVLGTKLHVPAPRRELVPRARLTDRLAVDPGSMPRLVLISAAAGFGKTTLLTQWLASGGARSARRPSRSGWPGSRWTRSDSRPAPVPHASRRGDPDEQPRGGRRGPGAAGDRPGTAGRGRPGQPRQRARRARRADGARAGRLPRDRRARRPRGGDVPARPPATPASRSRSPPARTRPCPWRGCAPAASSLEMRAADLRFTADEAGAFLNDVMGLRPRAGARRRPGARTEGWAAGLQLAALSARGRSDTGDANGVARFVEAFTGSHRFVLDYLVEEVLDRQPDEVRAFLLDTSVLDQLTGALCDAVTGAHRRPGDAGDAGAGEPVRRPAGRPAPVVPLPPPLRRRAARAAAARHPERVASCTRPPADGTPSTACWTTPSGTRWPAATTSTPPTWSSSRCPTCAGGARTARCAVWLAALPDDVVRRRPLLASGVAWSRLTEGDLDGVEAWLDAAEAASARRRAAVDRARVTARASLAERPGTGRRVRSLPAMVAVYRASVAQARGDVDGTVAHARRALELAGPGGPLRAQGGAGFLGLAAWAAGDLGTAVDTFTEAVAQHAGGRHGRRRAGRRPSCSPSMWLARGRPGRGAPAVRARAGDGRAPPRPGARHAPATCTSASPTSCASRATSTRPRSTSSVARELGDRGVAAGEPAPLVHRDGRPAAGARRPRRGGRDARPGRAAVPARLLPRRAADRRDQGPGPDRPGPARRRAGVGARARGRADGSADLPGRVRPAHPRPAARRRAPTDRRRRTARRRCSTASSTPRRPPAAAAASSRRAWCGRSPTTRAATRDPALGRPRGRPRRRRAGRLPPALPRRGHSRWRSCSRRSPATRTHGGRARRRLLLRAAQADRAARAVRSRATEEGLSERELEVLRLLATELTGPEIARQLFVSVNTLRTHTKHIFTKLDVNTRRAAVRRAAELGLL